MDYMLSGYASAIIWFKRATQINIKNYQDEKHEQIIIFFSPGYKQIYQNRCLSHII